MSAWKLLSCSGVAHVRDGADLAVATVVGIAGEARIRRVGAKVRGPGRARARVLAHGRGGEIACRDCGFREEITSFMHGFTSGPEASAREGRQCLQCGKFTTVHLQGNYGRFPPAVRVWWELSRDHFLFCPTCRSKNLSYGISVMS